MTSSELGPFLPNVSYTVLSPDMSVMKERGMEGGNVRDFLDKGPPSFPSLNGKCHSQEIEMRREREREREREMIGCWECGRAGVYRSQYLSAVGVINQSQAVWLAEISELAVPGC